MSNGLDDLFGAFDGEDGGSSSDPEPETKKKRLDSTHTDSNSKDLTSDNHDPSIKGDASTADTSKQKSAYSAAMSVSTASRLRPADSTQDGLSAASVTTKKTTTSATTELHPGISTTLPTITTTTQDPSAPLAAEPEINTGTSHDKSVRSYSAYPKNLPPGHSYPTIEPPKEPSKTYPFKLDPFQSQAVSYIDKEESVLVAAHTSAGKTAVAEYAVAKSLKNGQRVVYTSPIKALSNQKFRDLQEEFSDVGLMTGDITINPEATALVMTTEILRSMLYRGSELMREVAWVIYDEVHYMRDSERGVVWEESIILLPHRVRFVFLSATIPNASQFADWIAEIHHQPCHVVYTNYRPVPLQHYIFPQGGEGLHLVVDERGKFREANFQKAMAALQSGSVDVAAAEAMLSSGNAKKRGRGGKKQTTSPLADLRRIVKLIMERSLNPVIVFSFSKKDCEKYALALNKEDYTDDVEKDLISQVYVNAIEALCEDDRKLPQVEALLPLLKKGIGIHHGGLLPILKEIVEILFSEGLIKILFATETFSIGINMPAKTVVFTNTRKFDGKDFRYVTSGEYIQMSGRAGRRGKDDRGIVIQMVDEKIDPAVSKDMLYGAPNPLNSSYRISYNMLLNLMRVEDVDPEYLLRASFHQFQREKDAPGLIAQAEDAEREAEGIEIGTKEEETLASQYYQMDQQLTLTKRKIATTIQKPEHILRFVQKGGRFLDIRIGEDSYGWGVLFSCKKKSGSSSSGDSSGSPAEYSLEVLLHCVDRHFDSTDKKGKDEDAANSSHLWKGQVSECRPVKPEDNKKIISIRLFTVGLENIDRLSAVRIFVPQDVIRPEPRKKVSVAMEEVVKRFPDGIPLLDPVDDLGIQDEAFQTLLERAKTLAERLTAHAVSTDFDDEKRVVLVQNYEKKVGFLQQAKILRDEARSCQTIAMKDDLKKMKRVLKRLGHVDANGVIQTKGRTACEINTAHELVVVELIFAGIFNDLSVEQCVSLMSCMTFGEKSKDEDDPAVKIPSFLSTPYYKLQEIARTVVRVESACGVDIDEDEFLELFNPEMMEAVYAWCKGAKFVEVQKLTKTFEGTTIRTLRRLEELIRQVAVASKAIGNVELQAKFEKGSDMIKRDIVFCSSLYL